MGCCVSKQLYEKLEEKKNEIIYELKRPIKSTNNNYDSSDKIKIDMVSKNEINKDDEENNEITNNNNIDIKLLTNSDKTNEKRRIKDSEYEDILKIYSPLAKENNDKIEIKKNLILEDNKIYYGEYNSDKKIKEGRGIQIWPNGSKLFQK